MGHAFIHFFWIKEDGARSFRITDFCGNASYKISKDTLESYKHLEI